MVRFKPKSIREEGIRAYLDRTASEHNNNRWKDFARFYNDKFTIQDIRKLMNMNTRNPIYDWIKLGIEQEGLQPRR